MKNSRFSLRAAIVGYAVAVAFAFNGLLTSAIDANLAAGGSPFAILCLSSDGTSSLLPGQRDNAAKCSCTLSCCCAGGDLKRVSHENDLLHPAATALAPANSAQQARNFLADGLHRLRSPPATLTI